MRPTGPIAIASLVGVVLVAVGALVYFRWSVLAAVTAADEFRPEPPGVQLGGTALIVFVVCVIVASVLGIWLLRPRPDSAR